MSVSVQNGYSIQPATADSLYYNVWKEYSSSRHSLTSADAMCLQARIQGQKGLRDPSALPMNWNMKRIGQLLDSLHVKDHHKLQKACVDRAKSGRERGHCKEKFDHAVLDKRMNSPCQLRKYLVKADNEQRVLANSGPTRGGSPLYNKRAVMLNKIRIQSAPERRGSQQSKALNHIEETIKHYSDKYKLRPMRTGEELSTHNATFIPTDKEIANSMETIEDKAEDVSQSETMEAMSSYESQLVMERSSQLVTAAKSAPELINWRVLMNNAIEERKKAQNADLEMQAANSRTPSEESDFSRSSSIERHNQVKHWVDNVSVSSEEKQSMSGTSSLKETDNKHLPPVLPEPQLPAPELPEVDNEEVEPELVEISPPTFICPSSEEKSRDYAVRLWLLRSNFKSSVKSKPLT